MELGTLPRAREGAPAGGRLEEDHAEAEEVHGSRRGRQVVLLGRHVGEGAHRASRRSRQADGSGVGEIDEHRPSVGAHDVVGLHVEVGQPLGVQVAQSTGHLGRQASDVTGLHTASPFDDRGQRRSLDVLGDQVGRVAVELAGQEPLDEGMADRGEGRGFGEEPAPGRRGVRGLLAGQGKFDRHLAATLLVPGQPRLVAPAGAEQRPGPQAAGDPFAGPKAPGVLRGIHVVSSLPKVGGRGWGLLTSPHPRPHAEPAFAARARDAPEPQPQLPLLLLPLLLLPLLWLPLLFDLLEPEPDPR